MRDFSELTEQALLALAIALEEEDTRETPSLGHAQIPLFGF